MVDVRFELTTNDPWSLRRRHLLRHSSVGLLVKRLTNRLPKLSLITLSPPLNRGILGLRMGLYVPTPMFFYNLCGASESHSLASSHEEIRFSLRSVFMVDVRFELTTNDPWSVDDAIL